LRKFLDLSVQAIDMGKANSIPADFNSLKAIIYTLNAEPTCTRNYQMKRKWKCCYRCDNKWKIEPKGLRKQTTKKKPLAG